MNFHPAPRQNMGEHDLPSGHEKCEVRDALSRDGALALSDEISAFWKRRGFNPLLWVEALPMGKTKTGKDVPAVFVVRSDMVNGVPR